MTVRTAGVTTGRGRRTAPPAPERRPEGEIKVEVEISSTPATSPSAPSPRRIYLGRYPASTLDPSLEATVRADREEAR